MSNVSGDSQKLIVLAQDITKAVQSIGATRCLIRKEYLQIGQSWKDSKYKEFEQVAQECDAALKRVETALIYGAKYVAELAKELLEYENTKLGGSGYTASSRLPDGGGETNLTFCLGVPTRGKLPNNYRGILADRCESASEEARSVFEKYAGSMKIQCTDLLESNAGFYCPQGAGDLERGIYYNAEYDMINSRGAGTTFFHEIGHMIDHASCNYNDFTSNNVHFRNALLADTQNLVAQYRSVPNENRERFCEWISTNQAHSVSDLLDGITQGEISGNWIHQRSYWNNTNNIQTEAFAHFFEASIGGNQALEYITTCFPTAYMVFCEMLGNL